MYVFLRNSFNVTIWFKLDPIQKIYFPSTRRLKDFAKMVNPNLNSTEGDDTHTQAYTYSTYSSENVKKKFLDF